MFGGKAVRPLGRLSGFEVIRKVGPLPKEQERWGSWPPLEGMVIVTRTWDEAEPANSH